MIMRRKKKELPLLPEGWREETTERVKKIFLPEIQEEAHRILKRKETAIALAYMIDADSERFSVNRILKVLRICAYHASVKSPVHSFYRDPKVAARLIASLQTVMKELPFLFDEEEGVSTERIVFEEAIEFIELYSYRRRGKPPPTQKYLCLLHMEKLFRKWFGRPVYESIAAWMKATFPRDYREHDERDRPPVLTIVRELKRARILLRSPSKDMDSNP
jgi:hypothetical protein